MRPLRRCHVCFNVYQGVDVERCSGCLHVNRRADPWVERYIRTLSLQGRWRDDDDVRVSETAVAETAEHPSRVRTLRRPAPAAPAGDPRAPVIAACSGCGHPESDHHMNRFGECYARRSSGAICGCRRYATQAPPVIAACSDHAWYGVAVNAGPRWSQITARIAVCPTCHFARAAAPGPQCQPGDHDERTPGSTRAKSYQTQVLETVVVSLAFVALGLLIRWATT